MEDKTTEIIIEESSTDQTNKEDSQMRNAKNKKVISDEQRAHLAYARNMKKLKQANRESEIQVQNNNLDFIYRRLTNIENQIRSIADTNPPTPPTPVQVPGKRPPLPEEVVIPQSQPPIKKQKIETKKEETITDSIKYYAMRGAILFGTGLVLRLGKQYFEEQPLRKTQDGDHIGNYYIGPET